MISCVIRLRRGLFLCLVGVFGMFGACVCTVSWYTCFNLKQEGLRALFSQCEHCQLWFCPECRPSPFRKHEEGCVRKRAQAAAAATPSKGKGKKRPASPKAAANKKRAVAEYVKKSPAAKAKAASKQAKPPKNILTKASG